jgi:hypothetical protein
MANIERLLKLAQHLRHGVLGHAQFHFMYINADAYGIELTENGCGTMGCAMGECPTAFPEEWHWVDGVPRLVNCTDPPRMGCYRWMDVRKHACEFFEIATLQAEHLFLPRSQRIDLYGGQWLRKDATKEQVADNIEAFVKWCTEPQAFI